MKKLSKGFLLVFMLLLFSLGAIILLTPDRPFSEQENRMLKTKSDISRNVLSGAFQADLNNYFSDQFPLRDVCTAVQSRLKQLLGRRDIGGAYLGAEGRLFQKITDANIDLQEIRADANRYARLQETTGLPLTILPVPSAGIPLQPLLPNHAQMYRYDAVLSIIRSAAPDADLLDLRPLLSDPSAYYRTDHHWTTAGAFLGYRALLGITEGDDRFLMPPLQTVTQDFRGTLYSKVQDNRIPAETIELPDVPDNLNVTADGAKISVYDFDALQTKDKYNVFLSGNHGLVTIENPQQDSGAVLLLIKDSFANALVPFLVRDYAKIVMLDERYAVLDPAQLAQQEHADAIAVVKEAAFF